MSSSTPTGEQHPQRPGLDHHEARTASTLASPMPPEPVSSCPPVPRPVRKSLFSNTKGEPVSATLTMPTTPAGSAPGSTDLGATLAAALDAAPALAQGQTQ
jgi:hypothetical protein